MAGEADIITAGIDALGQLFSGVSDFFASRNKAKAYEYQAQQASSESGVAASQALTQGDIVAARAATQAAANGGGLVGSSIGVISYLGQQAMFNARAAAYKGTTEASADRYKARLARRAGVISLISTIPSISGSLIGSWAKHQSANKIQAGSAYLEGDTSAAGAAGVDTSTFGGSDELAGLY